MTTELLPCGRERSKNHHEVTPKQLNIWQKQLDDFVNKENMRSSQQRWQIAEVILLANRHLSAQAIVDLVKGKYPKIGVATVYRNIKVLTEAKILHETFLSNNGTIIYEPNFEEHHDHIVCIDCGSIFEFHNDQVEKIQESVLENHRFSDCGHRHILYGKCQYKSGL